MYYGFILNKSVTEIVSKEKGLKTYDYVQLLHSLTIPRHIIFPILQPSIAIANITRES